MNTNPYIHEPVANDATTTEKLRDCLRSELSAAETYDLALGKVNHVGIRSVLHQIHESHARRADRIDQYLLHLGAEAPDGTGAWGAFAKAMQTGADLFGDRAAITALKEGEDHGLKLYVDATAMVDGRARRFIEAELLPEQRRTRDLCVSLKDYATAPS
jgi:Domain of unknown function (DUF2383)